MFSGKYRRLVLGIIFDLIGMGTSSIFLIGDVLDIVWAPLVGWLLTKMYPDRTGVTGGIITTVEELIPGMDIIPTFTLTWVYAYILRPKLGRKMDDKTS